MVGKYWACAHRAIQHCKDGDADLPVRNPANSEIYVFLRYVRSVVELGLPSRCCVYCLSLLLLRLQGGEERGGC